MLLQKKELEKTLENHVIHVPSVSIGATLSFLTSNPRFVPVDQENNLGCSNNLGSTFIKYLKKN